jgi:hypothetical protein
MEDWWLWAPAEMEVEKLGGYTILLEVWSLSLAKQRQH